MPASQPRSRRGVLRVDVIGRPATCELSEREVINLIQRARREIAAHPSLRRKAHRQLCSATSLQLALMGTAKMRKLNGEFRGANKATDILSFAATEPGSLGELALCWPVIRAQARAHAHSVKAECFYMLVHGILHLLGYDHEATAAEARRMFKIQDEIFARAHF